MGVYCAHDTQQRCTRLALLAGQWRPLPPRIAMIIHRVLRPGRCKGVMGKPTGSPVRVARSSEQGHPRAAPVLADLVAFTHLEALAIAVDGPRAAGHARGRLCEGGREGDGDGHCACDSVGLLQKGSEARTGAARKCEGRERSDARTEQGFWQWISILYASIDYTGARTDARHAPVPRYALIDTSSERAVKRGQNGAWTRNPSQLEARTDPVWTRVVAVPGNSAEAMLSGGGAWSGGVDLRL